jgi:hypothetical protein
VLLQKREKQPVLGAGVPRFPLGLLNYFVEVLISLLLDHALARGHHALATGAVFFKIVAATNNLLQHGIIIIKDSLADGLLFSATDPVDIIGLKSHGVTFLEF